MKASPSVLLLIGAISKSQAVKLGMIPQNIVQTGSVDENSINWDKTNVQTNDVYDYDWDYNHPQFKKYGFNVPKPSQYDGFFHVGNKAYDPRTYEEVDFDDYDVQMDQERFGGEPIGTAMARIDLVQWHGQDVDLMDHEERYDELLERYYEKQERAQKRDVLQISQIDGMIHTADGKEYDPATGREVETEWEDIQTGANDWYDEDFERNQNRVQVNQFDGLIHTPDGRMFSPTNGREVLIHDTNYLQTNDIFDEDLEATQAQRQETVTQFDGMIHAQTGVYDPRNGRDMTREIFEDNDFVQTSDIYDDNMEQRMIQKQVESQFHANPFDGMIHAQNGKIFDPTNGRDVTREMTEENDYVAIDSEDRYDDEYEINPERAIQMKGLSEKINPATGQVGGALVQKKSSAKDKFDQAVSDQERQIAVTKPNQFDGLLHMKNGQILDPETHADVREQLEGNW